MFIYHESFGVRDIYDPNFIEENCRKLEQKQQIYELWARIHSVRLAPEKCQLINSSSARKRHNLKATIKIQGHTIIQ